MPLFPDRNYGSGISRRGRLDIPSFTGDPDEPVTVGEMNSFLREVKEWADSLMLGRIGFQAEWIPGGSTVIPVSVPPFVLEWKKIVEDSHDFTQDDSPTKPLSVFQIPPGLGRVYTVSWAMTFAIVTPTTINFAATGAVQSFTLPATLAGPVAFNILGGGTNFGGAVGYGQGQRVTGNFPAAPSSVWQVYVASALGWPNGGLDGAGGTTLNGAGSTHFVPTGQPITAATAIAGGAGGSSDAATGTLPNGGSAGHPAGGAGEVGSSTTGPPVFGPTSGGGGTQTAGGAVANSIFGGGTSGTAGVGGIAQFTFGPNSGGGGGGWYGGGGAGGANPGEKSGGGGGGSSRASSICTDVVYAGPSNDIAQGSASFTYNTEVAATGSMVVNVIVAYKDYPGFNPYAKEIIISSDTGLTPLGGSIQVPLNEGDRIRVEVDNNLVEATVKFKTAFLSVYATHNI